MHFSQLLLIRYKILHNLPLENSIHKNHSIVSSIERFTIPVSSRDGRMGIHVLFIYFCKAFDLVDHGLLLRNLAKMNVSKSFWLWTRSFLEGRSQQVKLRGALSSIRPCHSGVPQGSVISPTLFNAHVDDLEDCIPNYLDINTHKYAYHCTQDEVIPDGSTSNIQEVLDAMNDWALNAMKLNAKKTKDMWICFKKMQFRNHHHL